MVSALGASWGSLGTFLVALVGLLVALGASFGASWDLLGLLGRLLVRLGASLGPCWGFLVALGVSLGVSWDLLGLLGRLLVALGASLGPDGASSLGSSNPVQLWLPLYPHPLNTLTGRRFHETSFSKMKFRIWAI